MRCASRSPPPIRWSRPPRRSPPSARARSARSPSPAPDVLGRKALGLILPAVTGVAPALTPLAAAGLAVVMVLAALAHVRREEPGAIAVNAILFLLAAFVAWGRFGPHPL
ncbi:MULTISPECIES: DoxX family protein [unclassified Nonomuraea]|uniref:DoxX family protein n=1 Tax=unclassified Nonomuraea TaxID=2593643 RepID=UPI0033EC716F